MRTRSGGARKTLGMSGVVIGAILLAACEGSDVDPQEPSIRSMLSLIPADVETEEQPVQTALYTRAAEQAGVTVPSPEASTEEAEEYFIDLLANEVDASAVVPSSLVPFETQALGTVEDEFGYAPQAITADLRAGAPPNTVEAAVGEFVAEDVTAATTESFGPEEVSTEEIDDVPVARWLEDREQNLENPHALSQLGVSGRLGVADEQALLYGTTDAAIEDLVGAYHQDTETLADHDDLVTIAEVLDEHEARAAALSDTPVSQPPDQVDVEQIEAAGDSGDGIGEYRAYGVGITGEPGGADDSADASDAGGSDEGAGAAGAGAGAGMPATGVQTDPEETGSHLLVVLVAESSNAAEQVADRLEQVAREGQSWRGMPWADVLATPSVTVDDTVVTASFALMRNQTWMDLWVNGGETLLYTG